MTQHSRVPLFQFPLSSTSRKASRVLTEMIQTQRILLSGFNHNPKFSLGPHKIISAPNQQGVVGKTMPTFPKKCIMDVCLCLERWLQDVMDNCQEKLNSACFEKKKSESAVK